nr:NAD-dependent epimerase/dehydratase [Pithovirus mammoth]
MGSEANQGFLILGSDEWIGRIVISYLKNLGEDYFIFHPTTMDRNSIQESIEYYRPAYLLNCRETDLALSPENNKENQKLSDEFSLLAKVCRDKKVHLTQFYINCSKEDLPDIMQKELTETSLVLRFSFPFHYDLSSENFLSHLQVSDKEKDYPVSILPEVIPKCLQMIKDEICGDFSLSHPEKISVQKISQIYHEVANRKEISNLSPIEKSLSKIFQLHLAELERNQLLEM